MRYLAFVMMAAAAALAGVSMLLFAQAAGLMSPI